ncbi:Spermidine synthase [Dufourea novaeangliae]|nr:Spermidine synthase [Dufourea novaeangliae]
MDMMNPGWFSEISDLWPGVSLSLEVVKILHRERSPYQDVMVLETRSHGRALILDGIIQCTEKDEFSYQEAIAFLPLCSHPNPKTVLIVGGGDGGVAREVAKHPDVERIVQVEIDAKVLEVSRKYLPVMGAGLDHPKVTLNVGDGFEFLKQHKGEFDVIITDSSDPVVGAVAGRNSRTVQEADASYPSAFSTRPFSRATQLPIGWAGHAHFTITLSPLFLEISERRSDGTGGLWRRFSQALGFLVTTARWRVFSQAIVAAFGCLRDSAEEQPRRLG